jgi:hypothetical protein
MEERAAFVQGHERDLKLDEGALVHGGFSSSEDIELGALYVDLQIGGESSGADVAPYGVERLDLYALCSDERRRWGRVDVTIQDREQ